MQVFILAGVLGLSSVSASPITTLFNTGVDPLGALLSGGNGIIDPHYTIISGPGIGAPISAVTFTHVAYLANGPSSRWISSSSDGSPGSGTFVFRTTFDLTGFNPGATSITVQCSNDDALAGIQLNGSSVAGTCSGFNAFGPAFVISSNFVSGLNTLDFSVLDTGQPMAFRAQFVSDTSASGVPEPGTLLMSAIGLALLYRLRSGTPLS